MVYWGESQVETSVHQPALGACVFATKSNSHKIVLFLALYTQINETATTVTAYSNRLPSALIYETAPAVRASAARACPESAIMIALSVESSRGGK